MSHKRYYRSQHLGVALLGLVGCATSGPAQRCLHTPISSRVSQAELGHCQAALQGALDRRDVFDRYMRLLLRKGKSREVVHWSHKVLNRDIARTDAVYYLAVGLRRMGRCGDAVPFYRLYASRQTDDPDPHYAIGMCLETTGQRSDARQAYEQYLALEKRAAYGEWRARATQRLAALHDPHAEASSLPSSATPVPTATPADAARATTPAVTTTPTLATTAAPQTVAPGGDPPATNCDAPSQKVSTDPFATNAYDQLATCLSARGQNDQVVRHMRTAIRDNPEWGRGWFHLGQAQLALGRSPTAKSSLRKACEAGVSEACQAPRGAAP